MQCISEGILTISNVDFRLNLRTTIQLGFRALLLVQELYACFGNTHGMQIAISKSFSFWGFSMIRIEGIKQAEVGFLQCSNTRTETLRNFPNQ
jgi:hypothetical protein